MNGQEGERQGAGQWGRGVWLEMYLVVEIIYLAA